MQVAWGGVDKIYCISLAERTDRQAQAHAQFHGVGLSGQVEFVIVEKHPRNCEQGIYESHLLCMRKGIDAGADRILIFEDDIVFDRISPEILAHCTDFLNTDQVWHMLFLGCMVRGSKPTAYPSILNITYRSLTQGYVIHRQFAEFIIRHHPWQKVPFDDFLRDLKDDKMFAVYPSIAFQSNSRSDNERYLPLDRFRRLCGGLEKIQKRNEFYHRHKRAIIIAHAIVLLMISLGVMI